MSTNSAATENSPLDFNKPISKEIADMFGIGYDPANPKTMSDILQNQMAGSLKFLESNQKLNAAQIAAARSRLIDKNSSALNPEQQKSVEAISQILGLYPKFIDPIKITLATMVKWERQNESLMGTYSNLNPTKVLDILGNIQNELLSKVPVEYWPEELKAEYYARNPTGATGPSGPQVSSGNTGVTGSTGST